MLGVTNDLISIAHMFSPSYPFFVQNKMIKFPLSEWDGNSQFVELPGNEIIIGPIKIAEIHI